MKNSIKVILITLVVFFIIGCIFGNYNCTGHFCTFINSLVNFITDIVKTEVKGITIVINGIGSLFK